ncbi:MAG: hypothetical protein HMLIMOIP_002557 [Candidatus Nitrosomirales archaeon]|jgi:hypothetical protein
MVSESTGRTLVIIFGVLAAGAALLAIAVFPATNPIDKTGTAQGVTSAPFKLSIISVDSSGNEIEGYTTLSRNGLQIQSALGAAEFTLDSSQTYQVAVWGSGSYAFDHWSDTGSAERRRTISMEEDTYLTAVFKNTNSKPPLQPSDTSIIVYAKRVPNPSWGETFTSANAGMFIMLMDSSNAMIQKGIVDENGYAFTGLKKGATYYVYPADCDGCHGSEHDVDFRHWKDGSTARPRAVTTGSSVEAYFAFVPWPDASIHK